MNCDRRLLSDYLDGELSANLAAEVDEHLAACESCRQLVHDYRRLGLELRQMPHEQVPTVVEARIRARMVEPRRSRAPAFLESLSSRPMVPALGTLAAALLVVAAFVFSQQIRPSEPEIVSAYPPNGSTNVVLDEPILVEFDRPVNSTDTDLVVMIDPPAEVQADVVGNKVVLRPTEPLKPDTTYVVVVEQKNLDQGEKAAPQSSPVTISFSTGTKLAEASPVATPTTRRTPSAVPTASQRPTSPAIAASVASTSTPTIVPPTATSVPTLPAMLAMPSPTIPVEVCVDDVSEPVARMLKTYPNAENRLICAVKPAATSTVAQQSFANGIVLAVGGSHVYVLSTGLDRSDQTWTAYGDVAKATPGTATPVATETPLLTPTLRPPLTPSPNNSAPSATPSSVATTVATPTLPAPAIATPAPTSTVQLTPAEIGQDAAVASPQSTPSAPPMETGTPIASVTTTPAPRVGKEVGRFLRANPDVAAALGAPATAEASQSAVVQELAGGIVITYRGDEGYVLLKDGRWERVAAPSPTPTVVPTLQPTTAPEATPTPPVIPATPTPTVLATPTPPAG